MAAPSDAQDDVPDSAVAAPSPAPTEEPLEDEEPKAGESSPPSVTAQAIAAHGRAAAALPTPLRHDAAPGVPLPLFSSFFSRLNGTEDGRGRVQLC